jgi:SAM-dependent methyltransferase
MSARRSRSRAEDQRWAAVLRRGLVDGAGVAIAALLALALVAGCASPGTGSDRSAGAPPPRLDVIWVASDLQVVTAMLEAAKVGPGDVVYDLGCGDGIIVVTAASRYGARGVGVDLDPERIREARRNAARAGVTDRVSFAVQDLFVTDVSPATVVALYLSPEINLRVRPKLLRELRPGSRIVSHDFDLGDWPPERTLEVPLVPRVRRVYLWRIPDSRPAR